MINEPSDRTRLRQLERVVHQLSAAGLRHDHVVRDQLIGQLAPRGGVVVHAVEPGGAHVHQRPRGRGFREV